MSEVGETERRRDGGADERGVRLPDLLLSVTPEPTDDERDALVAALVVVLAEVQRDGVVAAPQVGERWQRAGRRAAMQGQSGGSAQGWGRTRRGWHS